MLRRSISADNVPSVIPEIPRILQNRNLRVSVCWTLQLIRSSTEPYKFASSSPFSSLNFDLLFLFLYTLFLRHYLWSSPSARGFKHTSHSVPRYPIIKPVSVFAKQTAPHPLQFCSKYLYSLVCSFIYFKCHCYRHVLFNFSCSAV